MKATQSTYRQFLVKYYLFTFLQGCMFISAVLVPFFTQWGGISQLQVQFLQSWFMAWIFILEVPTGVIADRWGRKQSLIAGALMYCVAMLVYGSIPHFAVFLLGEFLFAVAVALISGADDAFVFDTLKQFGKESEASHVFGRVKAVGLVGILCSALMGSLIVKYLPLNYTMLLSAVPLLLSAGVALSFQEPHKESSTSESQRYLQQVSGGFQFLYSHAQLRFLAVNSMIVAVAAYFVIWLYQPLLSSFSVDTYWFGSVHAFLVIVQLVIASQFGFFDVLLGSTKKYLILSALLTFLGFVAVGVMPNLWTLILFIIFSGGFGLTRSEYMNGHINQHIPSQQRATVLSAISMLRRMGLVLLNPLVGLMVDYDLYLALVLVSVLPLLAGLLLLVRRGD